MRPYVTNEAGILAADMRCRLYVKRDTMQPRYWRLAWMVPGETTYCMAEGECSAVYHRTRRDAIAYGERVYNETAQPFPSA